MTRNASLEEELADNMKQTETLRSLGEDRTRKQASELARQEKVPCALEGRRLGICFLGCACDALLILQGPAPPLSPHPFPAFSPARPLSLPRCWFRFPISPCFRCTKSS